MNISRKSFAEPHFLDGDAGGFEGYGSLFGIKDAGGDIVERGAYLRTLPTFLRDGFIGMGHDWSGQAIGMIEDAHEDEKGLFIRAIYHGTPAAQAARQIAQERLAKGKSVGLSIGYGIAPGGAKSSDDGIRHLHDLDLFEVSQVNVPLLRPAGITSVKGDSIDGDEAEDDEPTGPPIDVKLTEHQERVCLWVPAVVERWRTLVSTPQAGVKEGRAISTSRRERLGSLRDVLRSGADELDGLLVETAPPPPPSPETAPKQAPLPDGRALYAEFQRLTARLNGVAV